MTASIKNSLTWLLLLTTFMLCLLSRVAHAQTPMLTSVSGHVQYPSSSTIDKGAMVRFELLYCGANQPRVAGVTNLQPTFQVPVINGLASTALYGNDHISCGGVTDGTRWQWQVYVNNQPVGSVCRQHIRGASWNLDSQICDNIAPTPLPAPAYDITHLRIDGGNQMSGNIVPSANGVYTLGGPDARWGTAYFGSIGGIASLNGIHLADPNINLDTQINALGNSSKLFLPPGIYHLTQGVAISQNKLNIEGVGEASQIYIDGAFDAFTQTGQYFTLKNVLIYINTSSSRAGYSLFVGNTQIGHYEGLTILGNSFSPNNGAIFTATGNESGSGAQWFNNLFVQAGYTWNSVAHITNLAGNNQTAASFYFNGLAGGAICVESCFYLDGFIDTLDVNASQFDGRTGTTGPTIWLRNTLGSGEDRAPRWVRFHNMLVENGSNTGGYAAIQLDATRAFEYSGYIGTAGVGIDIGADVLGANIHDTTFVNIGREGIIVESSPIGRPRGVTIHHNNFDDTANSANNTYDTIRVLADRGFSIDGNTWINENGTNHPRYGINLTSSVNGGPFTVVNNNLGSWAQFGTGTIKDDSPLIYPDKIIRANACPSAYPCPDSAVPSITDLTLSGILTVNGGAHINNELDMMPCAAGDGVSSCAVALNGRADDGTIKKAYLQTDKNGSISLTSAAGGSMFFESPGVGMVFNVTSDGKGTFVGGVSTGTSGATNHAVCWKDTTHIGYCSTVPDASGICTCN